MMAAAGGLAAVGLLPVVTTFAVFCLRAIEQARLSIAYAGRNVKIVASHPGLDVGPDGGSAQCLEDIAAFRAIPGMTVISPADPIEMALATKRGARFSTAPSTCAPAAARRRAFSATITSSRSARARFCAKGGDLTHRRLRRRSGARARRGRLSGTQRHLRPRRQHADDQADRRRPCWRAVRPRPAPSSPPRTTTSSAGWAARSPKRSAARVPGAHRICRHERSLRRIRRTGRARRALRHRRRGHRRCGAARACSARRKH